MPFNVSKAPFRLRQKNAGGRKKEEKKLIRWSKYGVEESWEEEPKEEEKNG